MSQDIISDALSQVMNAKRAGKNHVVVRRYSKFLIELLELAKKEKYVADFNVNEKENIVEIKFGKINSCKAIKPRYNVKNDEIDKYVKRYLPAREFGILVLSTDKGLITHKQAYDMNIGGSLIAYFY